MMVRVFLMGRGRDRNMKGSKVFESCSHCGHTSVDRS